MKAFYEKTGNHKLRFKPAYNPYTEPSMEVFSWHEGLQKWIEIANVSGWLNLMGGWAGQRGERGVVGRREVGRRVVAVGWWEMVEMGVEGDLIGHSS